MVYLEGLPLPGTHVDWDEFWEACRREMLVIQMCSDCGWFRHYPRPVCPKCQSWNAEWAEVSGRGTIWSWTVVHDAIDPAVAEKIPYNVVEVVFEKMTREISLPRFREAG